MEGKKQVVVLVGGWADVETCVHDLKTAVENLQIPLFHFRYSYNSRPFEGKAFETMDLLSERLYSYIMDNNLNESSYHVNYIGYSQGGMLILYTLGIYPDLCSNVNKIVSIAAPHGGALVDQFRNLISTIYFGTKEAVLPKLGIFGQITDALLQISEKQMEIFGIHKRFDDFLKVKYPEIVKKVFNRIPKEHILEIFSTNDPIAPPESSLRFQEFMEIYQVQIGNHQKIANFDEVISKTIEFLFTK